jgi:hypothetical protein
VRKQELLLAAAQNLGLLLRAKYGVGTPRRLAERARQAQQGATGLFAALCVLLSTLWTKLSALRTPARPALSAWPLARAVHVVA